MPTLVMNISGPFAYFFDNNDCGFVTLMAPMCPQHLACISSIEPGNQYVFEQVNHRNHDQGLGDCQAYIYELRFDTPIVTPRQRYGGFLKCPLPQAKFDARAWRFWLRLPMPGTIVAINPVCAKIIGVGAPSGQGPYAIGARFVYKMWGGGPVSLWCGNNPVQGFGTAPSGSFRLQLYGDDHAYLDIDYSSPLRDDPGHEDAVDCFENLMSGVGLPWSIYIGSANENPMPRATKLNDCKSAVAWIGDGT